MLPYELISHIMKNCDLKTKTHFLLVNKELCREAKRQLRPIVKIRGGMNIRMEVIKEKDYVIQSSFLFDVHFGFEHYKEFLRKREYFKWMDGRWKRHRENKPAIIEWHGNGQIAHEVWYKNGNETREDAPNNLPAESRWFENGNKMSETWFKDGHVVKQNQWNQHGMKYNNWNY